MTTVLHLGVIDLPYADANYRPAPKGKRLGQARRGKANAPRQASNQMTTGDVAQLLEDKYHIMEIFADLHESDIISALESSVQTALDNIQTGAAHSISFSAEAETRIEDKFKQFLSNREMDGAVGGVPTAAARRGVSHRFDFPYAKRSSRPSFIDTGLYEANFKAWTD